ncbi:MAG: NRAMP family metal ion transporter [Rhodospirillales bacterium 69-11]|nr:divalent metal cation transporter [Rhodospirillales bacterium]OJW19050.1 MAG: NRAMP family metal ion transporter [Rhodospirillales bacterium 69-11]
MTDAPVLATAEPSTARLARYLAVFGPGLVVMLADTDVGSVITAGQSGVQWGYRLLLLQLLLVPILYVVQELTVRLAIYTGRGHGELIRETFGPVWAWVSVTGLGIATLGALLTEFAGVAGVGELFGIPRVASLSLAAIGLLAIVLTGSYRRVERVAMAVGLFELAFFFVAWAAHPGLGAMLTGAADIPVHDPDYLYLAAANIGAVIMPWMVFYQQSAIADKRLGPQHLTVARMDTAIGAVVTQLVMAAVLIACAATIGRTAPGTSLDSVGAMSEALTPFLGHTAGRLLFGAGVLGAGMVAAIVVSLALAWGLGEVTGYRRSLEHHPLEARWFYGIYALAVVAGAVLVAVWPNLVALNVGVQVMNALMLPLVLGFLIALAMRALPAAHRLRGPYLWLVIGVTAATCALGVWGGIAGALG